MLVAFLKQERLDKLNNITTNAERSVGCTKQIKEKPTESNIIIELLNTKK